MTSLRALHLAWCSERATGRSCVGAQGAVGYSDRSTKRAFIGNPETQMRM